MIYYTGTLIQCQTALSQMEDNARVLLQSLGYIIDENGYLVSKNSNTGEVDFNKARTVSLSSIQPCANTLNKHYFCVEPFPSYLDNVTNVTEEAFDNNWIGEIIE